MDIPQFLQCGGLVTFITSVVSAMPTEKQTVYYTKIYMSIGESFFSLTTFIITVRGMGHGVDSHWSVQVKSGQFSAELTLQITSDMPTENKQCRTVCALPQFHMYTSMALVPRMCWCVQLLLQQLITVSGMLFDVDIDHINCFYCGIAMLALL